MNRKYQIALLIVQGITIVLLIAGIAVLVTDV